MNWTKILSEIFAAGKTQVQVAEYCGCGQSNISMIYTGKTGDPKFSTAQRLLEMHKEVSKRKRK